MKARFVPRGMLRAAAARFLGLDREELRAQLPGTSLAALAEKQGKRVSALEAAMVAPASARLAKAAASGKITQARADAVLDRLETGGRQAREARLPEEVAERRRTALRTKGPLAGGPFVWRAVDRRELLHPRSNRTDVRTPCEFPKSCLRAQFLRKADLRVQIPAARPLKAAAPRPHRIESSFA